ncbi:MAG: response regulator [Acidobacteriota bacterium]
MMTPRKIMIVDDSEILHRMLEIVFMKYRRGGTALVHCSDGKEALDKLAHNLDTDLVLLDINMPVMSGLEFLQRYNEEEVFRGIPVIIITTEGREQDTIRGLQAGASAYVTKPFQPAELIQIVERVLAGSAGAGGQRAAGQSMRAVQTLGKR